MDHLGKKSGLLAALVGAGLALGCGGKTFDPGEPFDVVLTLQSSNGVTTSHGLWQDDHKSVQLCEGCYVERWSPDRRHVLLSYIDSRSELVSANGDRRWLEGFVHAWSPDGERLVFAEGGRTLIGDGIGNGAVQVAGDLIFSALWSPDGRFVALHAGTGVLLADRSGRVSARLPVTAESPRWTPDGELIAITTASGIAVFDPQGNQHALLAESGPLLGWSADSAWLAFGYIVNVADRDAQVIPTGLSSEFGSFSWSPVEPRFATIDSDSEGLMRVQVWSPTSLLAVQLLDAYLFSWTATGSLLCMDGVGDYVLVDVSDGAELARFSGGFVRPGPGGALLHHTSGGDLWTAGPQGENRTHLASGVMLGGWLADGEHVVAVTDGEVVIMRADGSGSTLLLYGSFVDARFPYEP